MKNLKKIPPKVIWLTGLSGSGKSTIAEKLKEFMKIKGYSIYVLDGDILRRGLNQDLGYDDQSRSENIRRAVEVAKILHDAEVTVVSAFISPFQKDRDLARSQFEQNDFIEVYLSAPLHICEHRDPKGLYKKARQGLIKNMTGIDSIYEPPLSPEITIDTSVETLQDSVKQVISWIESKI